jgi:pimeloyl-ACP methyl ester carboxylesterase
MADEQQTPDTIVLIQGPWMRAHSWEKWIDRYSRRGYRVIASATERLGTGEIVDHYDAIIRGLDRPPIVMGHALGCAIAEILLDRGLGAAGVAIDAVAVRGIFATSGSLDRAPLLHIAGAIVGSGWEEVADRALRWAVENGTGNARMVP